MRRTYSIALLMVALATHPSSGQQSGAKAQPRPSSKPPTEQTLRIRLEANPHDEAAHIQLVEALKTKYAFRAFVNEQAQWVKNNRGDYPQ
jgi:hypothetical protein